MAERFLLQTVLAESYADTEYRNIVEQIVVGEVPKNATIISAKWFPVDAVSPESLWQFAVVYKEVQ